MHEDEGEEEEDEEEDGEGDEGEEERLIHSLWRRTLDFAVTLCQLIYGGGGGGI